MFKTLRKRGPALFVGVLIGTIGAGAVAFATIPASSGLISGCYKTAAPSQGALRVIDPSAAQTCVAGETAISWNQRGLNWKGAWLATTAFAKNDAVSYQGNSYIARLANTNVVPTNTTNWAVLAQKGANGATGPTGLQGPAGPTGLSNYVVITGPTTTLFPSQQGGASAICPVGTVPLGGGESNSGGWNTVYLTDSRPSSNGWQVFVNNNSATNQTVNAYVTCATIG